MEIRKGTEIISSGVPSEAQLAAINAQAKGTMTAEQVYVFSLRLCDDQVDRDHERFDTDALGTLAKLFIGKTGIVDHRWSADNQVARIFAAEVVRDDRVSYIKAWAYIRRGGMADEVIADIEAGIKREVSVGCAMGMAICSVCGSEYGSCGHHKGEYYDGQLCCAILREPMDAYEFSFVAVPAQRSAGVLKGFAGTRKLKELADEFGAQGEYRALCKDAQLGRQYTKALQDDVVRLCLSLELGVAEPTLRSVFGSASGDDLLAVKTALENRLAESLPMVTQLGCSFGKEQEVESGFLI
ncbi:MAG: hypothetical protein IJZ39_04655 [Oscillospiraceae bacterium]|nr:hypothetical protein [Oscillospiraceae bacterium]